MLGLEQLTLMLQCNNSRLRESNATAVTICHKAFVRVAESCYMLSVKGP